MKILQNPISPNHKSAMFFDGIVATKGGLEARTFQSGELEFMDNEHIGEEIVELGRKGLINDDDVENEETVDIHVDKFIGIYLAGTDELFDEDYLYDNYDDAIEVLMQL